MKVPPPDVHALLNAAYSFEIADPVAWLDHVCVSMARAIPSGLLAHGNLMRWRGAEPPEYVAFSHRAHATAEVQDAAADPEFARAVIALGTVGLAAPIFDRGIVGTLPALVRDGTLSRMPPDVFALQAHTDDAAGAFFAVYLDERADPIEPAVRALWVDIAAHLAAAARLRLTGLPAPTAVLSESHKVLDANGPAQSKGAREALRTAARAVDAVRGRKVTDPEEALAIWRVLTEGRWTISDDFDAQGRRTIVAYENAPMPKLAMPSLTLRERQVVCFVALGHTNKEVAYELGLSVSSIAAHLGKAMTKLGVRSRAGLFQKLMKPATADAP